MSEVLDSSLVLHWYVKIIEITNTPYSQMADTREKTGA